MLMLDSAYDDEIEYPTSDGEPMGETDLHRDMMIDLIESLKQHFRPQPDVYVSGNILLYYEQGNPRACLSPDVLVTTGLEMKRRETYKLWEIGKGPDLVVEVTSRSTKMRDMGVKKGLYEVMGVKDYILFDPRSEYLKPRFQVFRLEGGLFVPYLTPEAVGYESRLGLTFQVIDETLRMIDTATGALLPTPAELAISLAEERQNAQAERQRADRLAERLRELGLAPEE
jgi:Uma2 family endonuclease